MVIRAPPDTHTSSNEEIEHFKPFVFDDEFSKLGVLSVETASGSLASQRKIETILVVDVTIRSVWWGFLVCVGAAVGLGPAAWEFWEESVRAERARMGSVGVRVEEESKRAPFTLSLRESC